MSVMGFKKKKNLMGGWGELYPSFYFIFGIVLTLQSPLARSTYLPTVRMPVVVLLMGVFLRQNVVECCTK